VQQSSAAHLELAHIMEKIGQPEAASQHYRQSLERKLLECS
jgi:Tfp pilus assembly protein PilF